VDLSWSFLTIKHLSALLDVFLEQTKRLKDINIAYNSIDVYGAETDARSFVQKLGKFMRKAT
jgi:hypothetical protein